MDIFFMPQTEGLRYTKIRYHYRLNNNLKSDFPGHWQPVLTTYSIAFQTSRKLCFRLQSFNCNTFFITCHRASDKSVGYISFLFGYFKENIFNSLFLCPFLFLYDIFKQALKAEAKTDVRIPSLPGMSHDKIHEHHFCRCKIKASSQALVPFL